MSANQPRKPAGTPVGGQWAPMLHAEPEVDLGHRPRSRQPKLSVTKDGTRMWRLDKQLHRTDGPAVEHPDAAKEW